MLESFYKVMGLDMSASIDNVKKRYRELSSNKEVDMNKINEAYRIIMINLSDKFSKYSNIQTYNKEEIMNMSNFKIKNNIDTTDENIRLIGEKIEKLNHNQITFQNLSHIYDLQAKIITIKYKQGLEALNDSKSKEKLTKFILYYFIPTWKNRFEKKYDDAEKDLREKWENDFDHIVFKVYYWMFKNKKAVADTEKIKNIMIELCNQKNLFSKELKRRNTKIYKK